MHKVKFLLDVNITPELGHLLLNDGHSFRLASNMESGKLKDDAILLIANENNEVIITHDLDFGELLAFNNDNKPSVVLFRIHKIDALRFYSLIKQNWNVIEEAIAVGSLVVIEEKNLRIRKLPLSRK